MIFDRVICGVDASEASLEAVRQAARLVSSSGRLLLAGVVELEVAVQTGWAAPRLVEELEGEAAAALERAHSEIAHVRLAETRLLHGPAPARLLEEIERERATLVCVGTHGHSRAAGIILGSLPTTLLHDAPCPVLVARTPPDSQAFPDALVAGVDGSVQADAAAAVAAGLVERFGATVRLVAAAGGRGLDVDELRRRVPAVELLPGKPVEALVDVSAAADLLLVGSRGQEGLRALGSVSERVAHQARCSVLVVR